VKDNVLTVAGERKTEHEAKGEGFHRVERAFGRFSRSLDLPRGPKPEERKPTRIEIGAGNGAGEEQAA
jgi:HSP20 family protein